MLDTKDWCLEFTVIKKLDSVYQKQIPRFD